MQVSRNCIFLQTAPSQAFHPPACRLARLPVAESHGFWESVRI